ncbi:MAG: hexose kinase [Oscillospiraceae bacterium]|nr:hexose kinase [Oscillospiraceae bacterium]
MQEKLVGLALNPALDVTLFVERLDPEYSPVLRERSEAAGKAVNLVRTAAAFGLSAPVVLLCGRDNREKYLAGLRRDGLRWEAVEVPGETRENISVCAADGAFLRLARRGFLAGEEQVAQAEEKLLSLTGMGTVVAAAGRLPQGVSPRRFGVICRRAAQKGAEVVVDTASLTLAELSEIRPRLIKPNFEELCAMTGERPRGEEEIRGLLGRILQSGVGGVLLSMGGDGMMLREGKLCLRARVPQVAVRSAVGAGDNSLAGFLLARLEGLSPQECLRRAAAFGTASVQEDGTCPPRAETVEELLPQIGIETL